MVVIETRSEKGAYSRKSVTAEQRSINDNQPKDGLNAF
jgi:hypothetical protein